MKISDMKIIKNYFSHCYLKDLTICNSNDIEIMCLTEGIEKDYAEFNCPICEEGIIILFFYPYYVTDCNNKMINPYIPSLCEKCSKNLNILMNHPELNPKELENMLKKLGVA